MTRVTYSQTSDLLKGDIPLAPQYGDGTRLVEMTADDIDAQLGHIYVTPFVIPETPENHPSILLLKKMNNLMASGRLICDIAIASENQQLNAYGASLYAEGRELLKCVTEGDINLLGAPLLGDPADQPLNTGPRVNNEDSYSLVENFYANGDPTKIRAYGPAALPYSGNK